ncbi:MAG: DNA polymerase III subunit delta [Myxococcota bacterium]
MTPEELRQELAAGVLRPAYLIAGEEALLRDDALALVREAVLAGIPDAFNFDRLDGETSTPAALLDAVGTLPVQAPRRLVLLREPEAARGPARGLAEALADSVSALAAAGRAAEGGAEPGGTVLVVVASKPDSRARWVRAFAEPAVRVRCDSPRGARELAAFVREEAERQGVALEPGAAQLLAERVGPQLLMLRQEIAKLWLVVGPGGRATRAHVSTGTSDVAEEPIWDLTDAIGEGRVAEALTLLHKLVGAGAPPPLVLGALVAHFRKLLRLRSGGGVAGPPFVRRKLEGQARRYAERRLLSCLHAIHETDTALKGQGALRPELALERLVIGLSA